MRGRYSLESPLNSEAPEFIPRTPQYNAFEASAPSAYRTALDAIYGLPFCGSLAFIGHAGENATAWRRVGAGSAVLERQIGQNNIRVESAGLLDGDLARMVINGVDYSPNQKGINILVVDPKTLDAYVGVFDTHTHIGNESHHLAKFLDSIPPTHFVLLAVRHDASRRLHPTARTALQAHGVAIPAPDNAEILQDAIESHAFSKDKAKELLSICATINAPKCAEVLIEAGWEVNYQRNHGSRNTPLLDATFHGSVETMSVLLNAGAEVKLKNKWNETAEDMATKLFGFDTLEAMIDPDNEVVFHLDSPPAYA
jgi:hypothetical protein